MASEVGALMVGRDCVGGACIGNGALPGTFAQITAVRPGKMYALRGDPKSLVAKEANQP